MGHSDQDWEHTEMQETGQAVAKRLMRFKKRSPYATTSWGSLARELNDRGIDATDQTLINYHRGMSSNGKPVDPASMNDEIMIGLARLYGCSLGEISRIVALKAEPTKIGRRARLLASYAAGDSNPEPAEYGLWQLSLLEPVPGEVIDLRVRELECEGAELAVAAR